MSGSLAHSIQCEVCQATFSRQEHLARHSRSHTTEKPFECPYCRKGFSRSDALHRHIKSHKQKPVDPETSSTRACKSCSVARVRCTRGNPCDRCKQRQLQCVYPLSRKRKNCYAIHSLRASSGKPSASNGMETTHPGEWLPLPSQLSNTLTSLENDLNMNFDSHWAPYSLNLEAGLNEWTPGMLSGNWPCPQGLALEKRQFDSTDMAPQGASGLETSLAQSCEMPILNSSRLQSTSVHSTAPKENLATFEPGGTQDVPVSSPAIVDGIYYAEGTVGRAAFNGLSRRSSRLHSTASEREGTSVASGFTSTSQEVFVSEMVYNNLVCKVRARHDSLSLESDIPTQSEIERYVQSYFQGFHATYPFLRKDPRQFHSSESWLLLIAVAAVGVRYTHVNRNEGLETSLSRLLDQIVSNRLIESKSDENEQPWIPGADSLQESGLDLITVQAALLNCLLLLHSGRKGSIRRALDQRYRLIEACDQLKLFSRVKSIPVTHIEAANSGDIVARWFDKEARIRTGWMIWVRRLSSNTVNDQ